MIVIDQEFQSLIPPLSSDEYEGLEKSLVENGYQDWREPIITWNGTIIDGHNRYNICDEHGIKFRTMEREFDSRDAAKIWIIENQSKLRRNLNPGQKATLEIDLHEAEVREAARLRHKNNGGDHGNQYTGGKVAAGTQRAQPPNYPEQSADTPKGRTAEILAKRAGVGTATIKRALRVKKEDPELYDKVRSGEVPVTTAYEQVTNLTASSESQKKSRNTEDGRRICSICGEPINAGEAYDYKPHVHKSCLNKRASEQRYANPDKSLLDNVPTYTAASLLAELTASAEAMRGAFSESIAINESMGVRLSRRQKRLLKGAVLKVFKTIQKIEEEVTNE